MHGLSGNAILASIVALTFLSMSFVVGALLVGIDASSTPLVVAALGQISTTIPALLVLLRVDKVHTEIKNGLIPGKVKDGLRQYEAERLEEFRASDSGKEEE